MQGEVMFRLPTILTISLSVAASLACCWPLNRAAQQDPQQDPQPQVEVGPPADWQSISSPEGKFTVEMPLPISFKKEFTRKVRGGELKIFRIGCEYRGATYLAERVDFPEAIRKGKEEQELDTERDMFAEELKGVVVSEKKVRTDTGRIGRDFTIRGQLKGEVANSVIRMREYLDGKSIYAVAVISPPDQELPEDAGRFLGSLVLGVGQARVAGKLEPDPPGQQLAGWGLAINPDGDCMIRPDGNALAMQVPGKWHDLNPDTNKLNSPRVVRTILGDFTISVKVAGAFKPGGKSTNPKSVPYNGAGIIIWNNSDNFIRLERGATFRDGKVHTFALFEEREGGYRGAMHNQSIRPGDCHVRIERRGNRVFGATSLDGTNWNQLKPIDTLWSRQVKVGLAAINSSSEPFVTRFEEFKLKGKEEGR
jgi:regulation of enolase protein 1 (concanavalin A-like superfamily)